jgi:hypothetical protein
MYEQGYYNMASIEHIREGLCSAPQSVVWYDVYYQDKSNTCKNVEYTVRKMNPPERFDGFTGFSF